MLDTIIGDTPEHIQVPAVALNEVVASSGGYEILDKMTISFPVGQCSVILGAAGSGKSTLLKVAAGLIIPDSGSVLVYGKNLFWFSAKQDEAFRETTGFVFQNAALWQNTNILNNVALPMRVHRKNLDEKQIYTAVSSVLRKLGYTEDLTMRPAELSAGEQKLVSIARAVILDPALLFMDDPTGNLDEDAEDRVYSLLDEMKANGRTIIIVTNNSELAYRFADNLGVIKGGRMVAFGCYDEVISKAGLTLSGSFSRLKARGSRACREQIPPAEAGSEMSNRSDI